VEAQSASTVVCALSARSAVGHKSASTVVCALCARSAVGDQSASTVVGALYARSAVGLHQSASPRRGHSGGDERRALAGLNLGGLGSASGMAGAQDF
jgi:hypothetical protein